ncbi:MAG: oligosaccharide flippase family protein [Myxococcales bacterium]|nr:oligosaccharide flippase family protein [Myxococcales bacterium]
MASSAEDTRRAGRGWLAIAGAKIYFILASYAVQLLLPRIFGDPETFGLYGTLMGAVSILNNVLIVATIQSVSKLTSEDESRAPAVLRQGLRMQLVVGGVLAVALFGAAPALARVQMDPALEPLFRVAAAVVLGYALYAALMGNLNGRHRFGTQARLDAVFSTLRSVGILGGAALGLGAIGAVAGFAGAAVAVFMIASVVVGFGARGEGVPLRRWLSFVGPIWVYQGFLNAILLIDVQVLKRTVAELAVNAGMAAPQAAALASTQVGFYRAAQTFAFVPYQLILSLTIVIFPMISRATASGDLAAARQTIRAAVRLATLLLVALAAPIAGAADGVMRIAYPEEYLAGGPALGILIFGIVAFSLFVIAATVLSSSGRPTVAATIAFIGMCAVVVGDRVLVVQTGLGGHPLVALATGTSAGMALALLLAGGAVFVRFRTFIPAATALRCVLAGAVALGVAREVPHGTRLLALVALALGFFAYVVALVVLRELRRSDLDAIRGVLGRR